MASDERVLVALMAEAYRLRLMRGVEDQLRGAGFSRIAGVDEAGRGCLAGPVVAAAVVLDGTCQVPGVDDSKKLGPEERARLAPAIRSSALAVSWVACPADLIDRINILEATKVAMLNALDRLAVVPDVALVDAVPLVSRRCPVLPLVRADSLSYAVACASIIAKWQRDQLMAGFDRHYPGYGFASNMGYGAAGHRRALAVLGPSPIHRLTFRSVLPRHGARARSIGEGPDGAVS